MSKKSAASRLKAGVAACLVQYMSETTPDWDEARLILAECLREAKTVEAEETAEAEEKNSPPSRIIPGPRPESVSGARRLNRELWDRLLVRGRGHWANIAWGALPGIVTEGTRNAAIASYLLANVSVDDTTKPVRDAVDADVFVAAVKAAETKVRRVRGANNVRLAA